MLAGASKLESCTFFIFSEQLSGEQVSIPVAFESFCKPEIYTDKKNGKRKEKVKLLKIKF